MQNFFFGGALFFSSSFSLPTPVILFFFCAKAMMVHCLLNPKFYYLEDSFLALREKSYSWMIIDHVERTFHTDLARAKFLSKKCLIADMKSLAFFFFCVLYCLVFSYVL